MDHTTAMPLQGRRTTSHELRTTTLLLAIVALCAAQTGSSPDDRLWHHRNLGKAYYETPTTLEKAVVEFRGALDLAPNSARERLNYGLALLRAGKTKEGIAELEKVQKQEPTLPHTWFNLGIVYRKQGEFDKAIPQLQHMAELVPNEPVSHYNLGVLYKQTGRNDDARRELEIAERLNASLAAPHFQLYNLNRQDGRREDAARELAEFQRLKKQQEGAVIPEDMEWSDYAEIYDPRDPTKPDSTQTRVAQDGIVVDLLGNGKPQVVKPDLKGIISIAAGDYDNDGLPDLCVLTEQGPVLMHNNKGHFERVQANLPAGRFEKAIWIDYDHDYDLDLLLLGEKSVLLRNQGAAGFVDHTADFPFAAGHAIDAVTTRVMADSKAFDLVVSYSDHTGVLYRDQLGGKYEASELPSLLAGAHWLRAEDVDHDGWLDLVTSSGTLLNRKRLFAETAPPSSIGAAAAVEKPPAKSNWIGVRLIGVKNLKLAYGAEVELKSGTFYQKRIYDGVPLIFDVGQRTTVDTVRTTWPNGLIQNEANQPTGKVIDYKEAERLSGSCPMIWTWDGTHFRFITDVLGVAPLGASSGDGQFFPVDHQEYIQIPDGALVEQNGRLDVRITEELSEVSYLDQVELFAVDHPAATDVFTSERWKGPPFPDFKMYAVSKRTYPVAARDHLDRDVRDLLLAQDHRYVTGFRHDLSGVAELHTLDLDFGPGAARNGKALLVLNGWVDWADGSTFLARSQEGEGLIPPYLQMKDANGRWKTVIEDMGMPDGKPKTIAVEVPAAREYRIVSNLCIFWDEIFVGQVSDLSLAKRPVPLTAADLRFRGFSKNLVSDTREQPEQFIYDTVSPTSQWNPTPGLYTRYGDVRELIERMDDKPVIMGSGDELRLAWDDRLKPVPPGWKRDYILKVDGWAKDRDANTAYSQTVEPLPFHAMSRYPYPASEHFPTDPVHIGYRKKYNTRPAATLIAPLVTSN
jgi:tetratricopeptide (TPR) repeat protein